MKRETAAAFKVVATGCTILFLVFLGLSAPFYLRQHDILKKWPRTQAKILAAEVVAVPGSGSKYTTRFLVQYRLGDNVLSTTINSGYGERFRSRAQAWVDRFPSGTTVAIAYDPLNPTQVRLDPGYNRYFFSAPVFITEVGLGFALVGLILWAIARKTERATRSSAPSTK